jgi:hypothetical protein
MGAGFDMTDNDTTFGTDTWERPEPDDSKVDKKFIEKAGATEADNPATSLRDLMNSVRGLPLRP